MNNSPTKELREKITRHEIQLMNKEGELSTLIDLIDDEFIEINSKGESQTKEDVTRWLQATENANYKLNASAFHGQLIASPVFLLTYLTTVIEASSTRPTYRSSLWRLRAGTWRLIYHQSTPLNC